MQLIEFKTLTIPIGALEQAIGTHRSSKDQVSVKQTRSPIGRLDFDRAGLTAGVPCLLPVSGTSAAQQQPRLPRPHAYRVLRGQR